MTQSLPFGLSPEVLQLMPQKHDPVFRSCYGLIVSRAFVTKVVISAAEGILP